MKKLAAIITAALVLGGCGASQATKQHMEALRANVPTCSEEAECKAKWEAAQVWVAHNVAYKIDTVTDVLIETHNPAPYDTKIAARITRDPLGGSKYRFLVQIWCNNAFGCTPNQWEAARHFQDTINAVKP